jgi:YihY family inner membrane protein
MIAFERLIRTADEYQRQRPWLALPVAVIRKYTDNQGWNLAALVAYYAFVAIFPLLLILITVLNILLRNDSGLRHRLLNSALSHYPVIGPELRQNIGPLNQTGLALVVGLISMFIGARGVAQAMQNALNSSWEIPRARRPKFPWSWLRGFGVLVVIGVGLVTTSVLSGLASGAGHVLTGVGSSLLALAVSLVLNVGMFWLSFMLSTAREIGWRQLLPGVLISALAWQVMQAIGSYLVTHQLARSSNLYGTFAIVLGLIGWLYLECLLTVWAVEANVVISRHLWPRNLVQGRGEEQLVRTDFGSSSAVLASAAWRPSRN